VSRPSTNSAVTASPAAKAGPKELTLEIANLEVVYKESILALEGLSIEVPPRTIVTVIGSNGAGKTTMLRAVTGMLGSLEGRITKGQIRFEGRELNHLDPAEIVESGVRIVPEGRCIFADLTVEENLLAGAHVVRDGRRVRESLEQIYDLFPVLGGRRRGIAGYMSGGEQQMLSLGRALISDPKLLILDEPSLGLAPRIVDTIFQTIDRIHRERNVTVLLVEQSAMRSLELASYGYVLQTGRVVLEGPSAALKDNEDVREFYLGMGKEGRRRSFREIKTYHRRKRWLA
jgi:branched-chain amino acid transport system ATP-binding protein